MASQADFLTSQKNLVVATSLLNQSWNDYQRKGYGDVSSSCISVPTVVCTGSGNLVSVSVVDAGTDAGFIYDAATVENLNPSARLKAILNTQGIYQASFRFTNGLVVAPGKDQAVTVTYSKD